MSHPALGALGMDPRFPVSREELYNLQMDMKQVQISQTNHAERILKLEKRQADDAALKSVWNSPFPGVLGGTPQHGPVHMPSNDMFDDLGEDDHLLSSLHLGPAEEEPARRGAASRANSVRFDESALHGSSWTGQNSRHSGEFVRPGGGLMMERSASHKSDGRHSSAGHSVHSHHSAPSGRASSLGLDTNFFVGDREEDSPVEYSEPPPTFFVLGSVPSIVRCWLTANFVHNTLLYADVCTGSQKSTVEYSLLRELDLTDEVHREADGAYRVRLPVYLAEATFSSSSTRSSSPGPLVPHVPVNFEVLGVDQAEHGGDSRRGIRIFLGSDALRAQSADLLLSQNRMTIFTSDRSKLSVPFVRPEDDGVFRHICTANMAPEKPRLNATAAPFVSNDAKAQSQVAQEMAEAAPNGYAEDGAGGPISPLQQATDGGKAASDSTASESSVDNDKATQDGDSSETPTKNTVSEASTAAATAPESRRESATGIWASWRHGGPGGGGEGGQRENGPLSGYQPPGRGRMKILKPPKSWSSSSTKPSASYEAPRRPSRDRRRSQASAIGEHAGSAVASSASSSSVGRWEKENRRAASTSTSTSASVSVGTGAGVGAEPKTPASASKDGRATGSVPRAANPIGGASAFSWMKTPTAAAE